MEHTWPLRYSVVFQTRLWKNRGARGQSITALACSYKASSLCGLPPTVHTHSSRGRIGSRGSATGGSSRSPIRPLWTHRGPHFFFLQNQATYLPPLAPGGGVTDGARQRGRRPVKGWGGFTDVVCNNIQQKGSTVLPVARCRCASEDGESSLLKLHLVSFLRGILHRLLTPAPPSLPLPLLVQHSSQPFRHVRTDNIDVCVPLLGEIFPSSVLNWSRLYEIFMSKLD